MTDIRQALEEAFRTIYGAPDRSNGFDYWKPELVAKRLRFNQLIQAEAWTDAAMCLVPEGWAWDVSTRIDGTGGVVYLHSPDRTKWRDRGGFADHPALALAQACLKAKEQADV